MQPRTERAADRPGMRERAQGVLNKHKGRAKEVIRRRRDERRGNGDDRGMATRPVIQGSPDRARR